MASFRWTPGGDFPGRYDGDDIAGVDLWRMLLDGLFGGRPDAAFAVFLERIQERPDRPRTAPRVFVSHRQADAAWGERIAWLASHEAGLDYWLDVHDPLLKIAGRTLSPTDPRYGYVIAAIIEMALLNCTHVIAAHTPNSAGSKWIPYELGRVKSRKIFSGQAAGWFQTGIQPQGCGEYVLLAEILPSDVDVEQWLVAHGNKSDAPKPYPGAEPARLP